jgi:hypothetical protein
MSEKQFYVYLHLRPTNDGVNSVFYVGKGLKRRATEFAKRNEYHKRIVSKYGKENIIVRKLLCESEQHAFDLEVQIISILRSIGVKLANATDGGEGTSGYIYSEEMREKASIRVTIFYQNNPVTDEWREANRKLQKTVWESKELRERQSKITKENFKNTELRKKYCIAQRLRHENSKVSDESRAKMSVAQRINQNKPEVKAKKREKMRKVMSVTTGESFKSAEEAALSISVTPNEIRRVCNGTRKSVKKHQFKYVN